MKLELKLLHDPTVKRFGLPWAILLGLIALELLLMLIHLGSAAPFVALVMAGIVVMGPMGLGRAPMPRTSPPWPSSTPSPPLRSPPNSTAPSPRHQALMSRPRRPTACDRPARTVQAALSGAKTLDEAAAILADIEGPEALRDARSAGEHDQRQDGLPSPCQLQRNHRRRPMPDTTPSLGLFWAVTGPDGRTRLLSYPCALADAEPYGDCLTSPAGHYETYEAWRRGQPKPPLALLAPIIARDEYETWPRGRIVYEQTPDRFVLYADRQLQTLAWLAQIKAHFQLPPERTAAQSDLHYRSRRAIGPP